MSLKTTLNHEQLFQIFSAQLTSHIKYFKEKGTLGIPEGDEQYVPRFLNDNNDIFKYSCIFASWELGNHPE